MKIQTTLQKMMFSTVRIEVDKPNSVETGTGFIYRYDVGDIIYLFLVTNRHIIQNAHAGRLQFVLTKPDGTPNYGAIYTHHVTNFEQSWHPHPDPRIDVAIMPFAELLEGLIAFGIQPFYTSLASNIMPTLDQLEALDAVEEVVFVGYPNGFYDVSNGTPIIRRGTTASPIHLDHDGLPAFIIDAVIVDGSSGSPVFAYRSGVYAETVGSYMMGERLYFLGIISGYAVRPENYLVQLPPNLNIQPPPYVTIPLNLGLGVVYKASSLVDHIRSFLLQRDVLTLASQISDETLALPEANIQLHEQPALEDDEQATAPNSTGGQVADEDAPVAER